MSILTDRLSIGDREYLKEKKSIIDIFPFSSSIYFQKVRILFHKLGCNVLEVRQVTICTYVSAQLLTEKCLTFSIESD